LKRFETLGKSKQFHDFLKNEIINGEYSPGDKFPSIRQLAEAYSISKITVNSVLSNLVTEGLLFVEQGRGTFVADIKEKSMNRKIMIGVMLFDFSLENNVEAEIINNIQMALRDGAYIIPYNSYNDTKNLYKGLKGFTELDVDGMIIVPPMAEDYDGDVIAGIIKAGVPMVTINRRIRGIEADFVHVDFFETARKSTMYLLGKKRRNIMLYVHYSPSIREFMRAGYIKAHEQMGLPVDINNIRCFKDENLIGSIINNDTDGLIASDHLIYKHRREIRQSGKRITEDLSIVGINDTVYSRFMDPPLTAIANPSAMLGRASLKLLMERIDGVRTDYVEASFVSEINVRST
jgi:GntR family transcriptional regulator, arabinose operon transcriptional repressor